MAKTWYWISLVGLLCLTASCGNQTVSQQPNSAPASPTEMPAASPEVASAANPEKSDAASGTQPLSSTDFFPNPVVASASRLEPVPVSSLIPPTASGERVPQVETGRSDPFASLNFTPTVVQVKPAATAPTTVTPVPIVLPSPVPVTVAPPVIVPPTTSTAPLSAVEVSKTPVAPPLSLAETVEISGIVQIAGKTNIIIKSPDEATSRYVTVGDRLGNGKVLVKRVEMGLEPTVILEQGGREIVRAIGSSNALIGAL